VHENEYAVRVAKLTASLKGPEGCLPDETVRNVTEGLRSSPETIGIDFINLKA
jgi:hypothetical protein